MATTSLKIEANWQKVSDGEAVVLQNVGDDMLEVATVKSGDTPATGFLLKNKDFFSYSGGDEVWVKCRQAGISYIAIDNIGA